MRVCSTCCWSGSDEKPRSSSSLVVCRCAAYLRFRTSDLDISIPKSQLLPILFSSLLSSGGKNHKNITPPFVSEPSRPDPDKAPDPSLLSQVVIADAAEPSDVSLSVAGTTPIDRSVSPPLDVLLLAESESEVAVDLERLAELLPGLVAEVRCTFFCFSCDCCIDPLVLKELLRNTNELL